MDVAVVVPFRGGCPHRERAWRWVREQYAGWDLVEARSPDGEWCKAAAINPVVAATDAEIVVMADADVWTDGLQAAVDAVDAGAPWAMPHGNVHRLSEEATQAVLNGADWRGQPLTQRPYRGVAGGGVLVARRQTLLRAPIDCRFIGWGQEDECHAMALKTLVGPAWRGEADLLHLYHPAQERMTRRRGSQGSWRLRKRYASARDNPAAMAALIEESRVASPTSEHPMHAAPSLTER